MSARCPVCHERVLLGERFCASCGATIGLLGQVSGKPEMIAVASDGASGIRPLPPSPPRPADPPAQRRERRRPLVIGMVLLVAALAGGLAALALGFGGGGDEAHLSTPPAVSTDDAAGAIDGASPSPGAGPDATAIVGGEVGTPQAASPVAIASPVVASPVVASPVVASPVVASPVVEIMPALGDAATPAGMSAVDQAGTSDAIPLTDAGKEAGEATDVQPRLLRALQRATLAYLRSGDAGPPQSVFKGLSSRRSMIDASGALTDVVGEVSRMVVAGSSNPPSPSALPEPPTPSLAPSGGDASESASGPQRLRESPSGRIPAGTLCLTDGRSSGGHGERYLRCDDVDV